jgi:hypothetical protein
MDDDLFKINRKSHIELSVVAWRHAPRRRIIHSHGSYLPNYLNNIFSDADKRYATNRKVNIFVSTPNGTLQEYDVKKGTTEVISKDIPSDKKDPNRQNNVSADEK